MYMDDIYTYEISVTNYRVNAISIDISGVMFLSTIQVTRLFVFVRGEGEVINTSKFSR